MMLRPEPSPSASCVFPQSSCERAARDVFIGFGEQDKSFRKQLHQGQLECCVAGRMLPIAARTGGQSPNSSAAADYLVLSASDQPGGRRFAIDGAAPVRPLSAANCRHEESRGCDPQRDCAGDTGQRSDFVVSVTRPNPNSLRIASAPPGVEPYPLEHSKNIFSSMPTAAYTIFRNAILGEQQVICTYESRHRELCPHIIGTNKAGEEVVLAWQFAGSSSGTLPQWRCLRLANVRDARARTGAGTRAARIARRRPASARSISTSTCMCASGGGCTSSCRVRWPHAPAISAPFSRSTMPMSYWPCRSSQNCALLPK